MFGYFGTGYVAWTLAHVLLEQTSTRLAGKQIVFVPLLRHVLW